MSIKSFIYRMCYAVAKNNSSALRLLVSSTIFYFSQTDQQLKAMELHVKPGSIIFDIGAYQGLYSIFFARNIKNSLIYAFEPNPKTYNELCKHIEIMKLGDRIIPKKMALGNDTGNRLLYISSESERCSLDKNYAMAGNNEITDVFNVDCASIDYLVENGICQSPDVMKIDVQGHEIEVLTGGKETIASKYPQIYIEPHKLSGVSSTKNGIIALLSQLKYKCESLGYTLWFYKLSE